MMNKTILFLTAFFLHAFAWAQLNIEPESWQFDPQQTGYSSSEKIFHIQNQGSETVTLEPQDIRITAQEAQSTPFSILTYNIWHDSQDWPARLERMLTEISELEPDIIGLQEVIQRPDLPNQAQTLADSLGYNYYFSSVDSQGAGTRFGNAILTKHTIENSDWIALEPLDDYRNAAYVRITVNGQIIDFYTTHLHNVAVNSDIREQQINDLLAFIEETNSGGHIFVTGDYNADPDWEEMELMYEDYQDVYPLFHENHLDPEHGTLNHHLGHIQRRIDYTFFKRENQDMLEPTSAEVVLDTANADGVYGSDHFGVFSTYTLLSDADAFTLNNIDETTALAGGESIAIGVAFSPQTVGLKEVWLRVQDQQAAISGEAFDATVHHFPWDESFDDLNENELPCGWKAADDGWGAAASNHAGGQAPEMVFNPETDTAGALSLKTPPFNTAGLDSMNISFRQHINNEGAGGEYTLKLVSIAEGQQNVISQWVNPTGGEAEHLNFILYSDQHSVGDVSLRLAWIYEGDTESITQWSIDEVSLEALPALSVSPSPYNYGNQDINAEPQEKTFTLSNAGGGVLTINPQDVFITGPDAEAFILDNLTESVHLENEDEASLSVAFVPEATGEQEATLEIGETTVVLSGLAFDPTITELPWTEDFSSLTGSDIPMGWSRDSENWGAFNSNNAGGEAPEMVFWWQPEIEGTFNLTTPEFAIDNADTLVLSFRHRVRNFGQPGDYTLQVKAITDDGSQVIHEWLDPATIEAENITLVLDDDSHDIGSGNFRLAWTFNGPTDNITQWDIDDIVLYAPADTVVPQVTPSQHDFGDTPVEDTSEPQTFTIKNIGGEAWTLHPDDIETAGSDAEAFILNNITEETTMELNESAEVTITFQPVTPGDKNAVLKVQDLEVPLTGKAVTQEGYFVYSDFSVTQDGLPYTNVGGFREVPDFVPEGSLTVTDISGEGMYGNTVVKLDYDLATVEDFAIYYMWAYPVTDLSAYNHLVVRIKAEEEVNDLKLAIQDEDGVSGEGGAAFTLLDVGTEWDTKIIPVDDIETEEWAQNPPDMSVFQKIDFLFDKTLTTPEQGVVYVDLVGLTDSGVSVPESETSQKELFNMYPNPAKNEVTIQTKKDAIITIKDMAGSRVHSAQTPDSTFRYGLQNVKPGIYLVQVSHEGIMSVKKLVVY